MLLHILFHLPRTPSSLFSGLESPLYFQVSSQTLPFLREQTIVPCTYCIIGTAIQTELDFLSPGLWVYWGQGSSLCTSVAPVPLHRLGQSQCSINICWINGCLTNGVWFEQQEWEVQLLSSSVAGKSSGTTFSKVFLSWKSLWSFAMLLGGEGPLPRNQVHGCLPRILSSVQITDISITWPTI